MFITSTGALQLWQQDAIKWTREESLAEIQSVEFIDLPEKKATIDVLDGHNFITRLLRQIRDVQVSFPVHFSVKFIQIPFRAFQHMPRASVVGS